MTDNIWTFNGIVKKAKASRGTEGGKPATWGSMWMLVQLNPVDCQVNQKQLKIDKNELFINIDLDYTKYKIDTLTNIIPDTKIFVKSARIQKIQRSKKDVDGSWKKYEETGIKAYQRDVSITNNPIDVNLGIISGKVLIQGSNKIIVADNYWAPNTEEWKTREIPILLDDSVVQDYRDRYVFAICELVGKNDKNEMQTYGITKKICVI